MTWILLISILNPTNGPWAADAATNAVSNAVETSDTVVSQIDAEPLRYYGLERLIAKFEAEAVARSGN